MRNGVGGFGRVVVIGATSEIAGAIVRELVGAGTHDVVLMARDAAGLHELVAELRERGVQARAMALDVDDASAAEEVRDIIAAGPDVDVVLFAVGVLPDESGLLTDPGPARDAVVTNFASAVPVLATAAAGLEDQGHGLLVVLSSVAAIRPRGDNPAYAGSKAGLDAFARGLGLRLRGSGAGVLVVRPGFVRTRMTVGLPEAPFTTTAPAVARDTVQAMQRGRSTVYSPPILGAVFTALRVLPDAIWARLGARR